MLVGPNMTHEDLTQFVYTLSSKFDHLGTYLDGMEKAVCDNASGLERAWQSVIGQAATLSQRNRDINMLNSANLGHEEEIIKLKHDLQAAKADVDKNDAYVK